MATSRIAVPYTESDIDAIRREAEEGNIDSMFDYALLHEEGAYVKHDYQTAALWYRRAAEAGDVEAQYRLGRLLQDGVSGKPDWEQAAYWFLRSALQGHTESQCAMGIAYYNGEGVTPNLERALYWHMQAAHAGDTLSQACLGDMLIHGEGISKPRPKQGLKWLEKAARKDDDTALYLLGCCHLYGTVTPPDRQKAFQLLERAASFNNAEAQYMLSLMLLDEEPSFHDVKKGLNYLRQAVRNQYPPALCAMGSIHEEGLGTIRPNKKTALNYYTRAAKAGDATAQFKLYSCYLQGYGTKVNEDVATHWLSLAAQGGHPDAQYHWGSLLFGTATNLRQLEEALRLLQAAAQGGNQLAGDFLKYLKSTRKTLSEYLGHTLQLFNSFFQKKHR